MREIDVATFRLCTDSTCEQTTDGLTRHWHLVLLHDGEPVDDDVERDDCAA